MAEERDLILRELALGQLGVELLLAQSSQHLAYVLDMLLSRLAEHENVVEECEHEVSSASRNVSFMSCMKVPGALQRPIGRTVYSKLPKRVRKTVFSRSSGWILI